METVTQPSYQAPKKTRQKSEPEKKNGANNELRDLEELINKHNKSLPTSRTKYEPRRHSVKDYKLWEKKTGKAYAKLDATAREAANAEISSLKRGK
jgi:hypothetical protein